MSLGHVEVRSLVAAPQGPGFLPGRCLAPEGIQTDDQRLERDG